MTKDILLRLNDEMAEMINQIKDILGLKHRTEAIRFCIKYTRSNIS